MKLFALITAGILLLVPLEARAGNVGFTELTIPNGADTPLKVGVWYPTDAPVSIQPLHEFVQTVAPAGPVAGKGLPLVVFSHGTGGWYGEHVDTALALAHAGFVVAAVSHTGDTYDDNSRAARIQGRPEHLVRTIAYMLADWPDHGVIDAHRVGLFGFSAGGFTALVAAGGVPDFSGIAAHCVAHPHAYDCTVMATAHVDPASVNTLGATTWPHAAHIRAAVIVAPALGFTFSRHGLAALTMPIQLWKAEDDQVLPAPDYADAVRANLPAPPDFHVVANAGHFDFLAPCTDTLRKYAPFICVSRPGFDRTAFHEAFDREVVRFFQRTLG